MSVSLRNLRAFVQLAHSASFAEAADKLHLSQPALSTSIKNMEQKLGGALFSRSTRSLQLSPEGREFLPVAVRLLAQWDEAIQDMQNVFAKRQGKLNIAAMPSFATGLMPDILGHFHQQWPNIKISVIDVVMEEVINAVRDGKVELGFTFEHEQMQGLDFMPMFTDYFVAIVPPEHHLAKCECLQWQDLIRQDFVAMNRGSTLRRWLDIAVSSQCGNLDIVAEAGQLNTIGELVRQGLGVSLVPGLSQQSMRSKGVLCIPVTPGALHKQVGVIRRQRVGLSVAAQTLWDQLQQTHYPQ